MHSNKIKSDLEKTKYYNHTSAKQEYDNSNSDNGKDEDDKNEENNLDNQNNSFSLKNNKTERKKYRFDVDGEYENDDEEYYIKYH
jgi:hypothetical protein